MKITAVIHPTPHAHTHKHTHSHSHRECSSAAVIGIHRDIHLDTCCCMQSLTHPQTYIFSTSLNLCHTHTYTHTPTTKRIPTHNQSPHTHTPTDTHTHTPTHIPTHAPTPHTPHTHSAEACNVLYCLLVLVSCVQTC